MKLVAALMLIVVLVVACSRSPYSRDDAVEDLMNQDLDRAEAECVADAVIAEFGLEMLDKDPEPTPEQLQTLQQISRPCLAG